MNIFNGPVIIMFGSEQQSAAPKHPPIFMTNTEFIRGYKVGLTAHVGGEQLQPLSDGELFEMLQSRIEEGSDDKDLYYFLGNIVGRLLANRE